MPEHEDLPPYGLVDTQASIQAALGGDTSVHKADEFVSGRYHHCEGPVLREGYYVLDWVDEEVLCHTEDFNYAMGFAQGYDSRKEANS